MVGFEQILELAKKYGIEVYQKGNGEVVYLKSANNTWYFYLKDVPDNINDRGNIYLYHKCNSKVKEHYHTQRKYSVLFQLFDSVSSHDQHMFVQRKKSRMEMLFEKIECESKSSNVNDKNSKLHNKSQKSKNKHSNSNNKSKFVS